jgi:hypothetical protein
MLDPFWQTKPVLKSLAILSSYDPQRIFIVARGSVFEKASFSFVVTHRRVCGVASRVATVSFLAVI